MLSFSPRFVRQQERLQVLATAFCILFGFLFLVNIHPIGDGLWYWYAQALRHGQRLYPDLHVPMQPFFFLLTETAQRLFGTSWLASKILAAGQVVAYSLGLFLVCRRMPWSDAGRAVLLVAVFGLTIMAPYARFDDFHITGHCLVVYSIYVLLRLSTEERPAFVLRYALLLGLLSGVASGNRLNDGFLLLLAAGAGIYCFAKNSRVRALLAFCATSAATLLLLILLTGSGPGTWLHYTILQAASLKGGSHKIFASPLHFPYTCILGLVQDGYLYRDFCMVVLFCGMCGYVYLYRRHTAWPFRAPVLLAGGLASLGVLLLLLQQALSGRSILAVSSAGVPVLYLLSLGLLLRFAHFSLTRQTASWNRKEILLLIPLGQMIAGTMTSGESFYEAFAPLALFTLVVPFAVPAILRVSWRMAAFLALTVVLAAGTLISKSTHAYSWQHYNDRALFVNRTWYNHPVFGPMYIDRPQLALMQSMCSAIHPSTQPAELLAMPWPYPNYFCNIAPWHGYVQTWYDTSSKQTIDTLQAELATHPPEWIAYQRGLDMMLSHEITYNHWMPIPHRAMDTFIEQRLRSGQWSLPWQRCFGGTDWMVIHTRPPQPGEFNDTLIPADNNTNLCSRTSYEFRQTQ